MVHVADFAVLEVCAGDPELVVGSMFDEPDDDRNRLGLLDKDRQARIIEPHADAVGQVLQDVAGQRQLGKDHQVATVLAGPLDPFQVQPQVAVQVSQGRIHLGHAHSEIAHRRSPTAAPRPGRHLIPGSGAQT